MIFNASKMLANFAKVKLVSNTPKLRITDALKIVK